MVRPIFESFTPAAADADYFANNVTGTNLTLAQTSTPDGLAHQITILNNTANDHSGKTITITGTYNGNTQTETITGPGPSATVTTTLYYTTLTSVVFSTTIAPDTVDAGYNATFAGRIITSDWEGNETTVGVTVTGTINYSVEYTLDNIQEGASIPYTWHTDAGPVVASTTNGAVTFWSMPMAWRLVANSYSPGATAQLTIIQMNHNH